MALSPQPRCCGNLCKSESCRNYKDLCSRPRRKNDQYYTEQKNYTHFRELFGYGRIDTHRLGFDEQPIEKGVAPISEILCLSKSYFGVSHRLEGARFYEQTYHAIRETSNTKLCTHSVP
jgi:hypothetical protein